MTRWSDLWVKPSVMVAMGVEVRTADWLERVEKEGYRMEAQLDAIREIVKYLHSRMDIIQIKEILGDE